jgi:hypothetical protein
LRLTPWREVPAAIWGCHTGLKPSPCERKLKLATPIARGHTCVVKSARPAITLAKVSPRKIRVSFYIKLALAESARSQHLLPKPLNPDPLPWEKGHNERRQWIETRRSQINTKGSAV